MAGAGARGRPRCSSRAARGPRHGRYGAENSAICTNPQRGTSRQRRSGAHRPRGALVELRACCGAAAPLAAGPCLGFDWPGEVYRIQRELEHSEPAQRRELVRRLAQYGAESVKQPVLLVARGRGFEGAARGRGRGRTRAAARGGADPARLARRQGRGDAARRSGRRSGASARARAVPSLIRALGDAQGEVRRAAVVGARAARLARRAGAADRPARGPGSRRAASRRSRRSPRWRDARSVVPLLGACADASAEVRSAALARARRDRRCARAAGADARALRRGRRGAARRRRRARRSSATRAACARSRPASSAPSRGSGRRSSPRSATSTTRGARERAGRQLGVPALRRAAALALVRQAERPQAAGASRTLAPRPRARAASPRSRGSGAPAGNGDLPVTRSAAAPTAHAPRIAPSVARIAASADRRRARGALAARRGRRARGRR